MQTLILTIYIVVCVLLVILILLQSGKEGMGVIFGGGNSSVFGSSGAGGILAKLTAFMAIVFVITALSYTYVTSSRPESESQILDVKIEDVPPASQVSPTPPPSESRQEDSVTPVQNNTAPDAAAAPAPVAPQQPQDGTKQ